MRLKLPDGSEVDVRIVRKRNMKRAILHAEPNGDYWLSMPAQADEAFARGVLKENAQWILEHKQKLNRRASDDTIRYLGKDVPLRYVQESRPSVELGPEGFTITGPTREYADVYFQGWWKQRAYQIIHRHVDEWYSKLKHRGIQRPTITVRKMKTRWGSCSWVAGTMRFNEDLLSKDESLIDYVVLHEMAHLLFPNHQQGFIDFMTAQMPDWRDRRDALNH